MKKIPTLFQRDWNGDRSRVTREVNPECQWVLNGEGVPTRKWDGTAVLVKDGRLYRRYEQKGSRAAPGGFIPAQEPDPTTGDVPGWVPVILDDPANRWLIEAAKPDAAFNGVASVLPERLADGTYELVGPKVQGNPDGFDTHRLIRHGEAVLPEDTLIAGGSAPRTYDRILDILANVPMEGIVWHHPDGRMAKVKRRDFGLPWPVKDGS